MGVDLGGGGLITNDAAGSISGGLYGVLFSGSAAGTLDNAGTIVSDGTAAAHLGPEGSSLINRDGGVITGSLNSDGAFLGAAGSITNQSGGIITSTSSDAVDANVVKAGDKVTIDNSGTLSGGGRGVYIGASGSLVADSLIMNRGSGAISGAIRGIVVSGSGTVTNAMGATIAGGVNGVEFDGSGTVSNMAGGLISAQTSAAVSFSGSAPGTVDNSGSIDGSDATASGIFIYAGGSVTNHQLGTIAGGKYGVHFNGGSGAAAAILDNEGAIIGGEFGVAFSADIGITANTLDNAGAISGGAYGVAMFAAGSVINAAGGTITGGVGAGFYASDSTLTNAGTIAGTAGAAVFFSGSANGRLIVDPGAVFIGDVDGGTGVLELASAGSGGTLLGVGGSITNFATVSFDPGGQWTLGVDSTSLSSAITGFASGDTIDLANFVATSDTFDTQSNLLTLTDANSKQATLQIQGSFATSNFFVRPDGTGGTDITSGIAWADSDGDWNVAGNWSPAIVPGASDTALINKAGVNTVTIASSESVVSNILILDGPGDALQVAGTLAMIDTFTINQGAVSLGSTGVIGGGTIADIPGGSFTFANGALNDVTFKGILEIAANDTLNVTHGLTVLGPVSGNAGTIDLAPGGSTELIFRGDQTINSAAINLDGTTADTVDIFGGNVTFGDNLVMNSRATGALAVLHLDQGGSLLLDGTVNAIAADGTFSVTGATTFANHGRINIGNGDTLSLDTPIVGSGAGAIDIGSNGIARFAAAVAADQTLTFDDATGVLMLDDAVDFNANIVGFDAGNTIDLTTIQADGAFWTPGQTGQPGFLLVKNGAATVATLRISGDYTGAAFTVVPSGSGSTITVAGVPPCFAEGTRVLTPRGAVPVERLREGDTVLTVSGARQRIQWVGYRHVDCRRHIDRARALPIRIARHAFGENRPKRPLLLSPDHSVFVESVLIPIKFLVNGSTIIQVEVDAVSYFHIELERHDVLLAEGLPAETYLETGGRNAFANGGGTMQLHPDFAPDQTRVAMLWRNFGYAPLLGCNGELERVQRQLAWQAAQLGSATPRRTRRAA